MVGGIQPDTNLAKNAGLKSVLVLTVAGERIFQKDGLQMKYSNNENKIYKVSKILAYASMLLLLTFTMLSWYNAKDSGSLFILITGISITFFLSLMIFKFSNSEFRVEKHAEKMIVKLMDINKEYKKVMEELKTAMEIKSAFTSMVSHELRTPLTSIKEGIGIVLDGSAGTINDEQKKFLELAKRNVDRLHRLINNVLDFTKLGAGKLKYNLKEEDLNKLVKEIVKAYEPVLTKKGLYIKTEFAQKMPRILLDADKISQVINNLLSNAEKFTEQGGIMVTTGYDSVSKQAVVKIIDTGHGIIKDDIDKLFQEFTTVGTKRMLGSTGLGLAICKQIIDGHFGKIYAESEPDKGSVFTFIIPVKGAKNA